jgi:hypothetical protein
MKSSGGSSSLGMHLGCEWDAEAEQRNGSVALQVHLLFFGLSVIADYVIVYSFTALRITFSLRC